MVKSRGLLVNTDKWQHIPFPKTAPVRGDCCRETESRWCPPSPPWGAGSSSIGKCSWQTPAAGTRPGPRTRGGTWPSRRQQTAVQLAGVPHTYGRLFASARHCWWAGVAPLSGHSAPPGLQAPVQNFTLKQLLIAKCSLLSCYCCKQRQEKAKRQAKQPESKER